MATLMDSEVRDKTAEGEVCAAMDRDGGVCAKNADENEKKDPIVTGPEEEDPFKKPALLTAPSLATKRSVAQPKQTQDEPKPNNEKGGLEENKLDPPVEESEPASENKSETALERDVQLDKERVVGQSKAIPKQDVKPRVGPVKAPPAGNFKPQPSLPYTEPPWGGMPAEIPYALEILKNGAIVDKVPLTQRSYFVVGRLPVCDVSLQHPSISRYHAVVQYRGQTGEGETVGEEKGFYVHDLGSTHGTFVNKNKVPPKTYIRLRVGHVLKFGGSTRLFILQGPEFDEEDESEFTVTELRERARKQREELEKRMMGDRSSDEEDEDEEGKGKSQTIQSKQKSEEAGCSWGMAEEAAPEEDENEENPFATEWQEDQEAAYLKDPKKALQGFYDREGEELEFEYEDKSHGTWLCRIKLPVDDAAGRQLVAEVAHAGKKKEAAVQCCLEACRILEARGLLRQEAVSRKRRKKNWEEEDFYDSDDDTFLDRTGAVEKKRQERMRKAGKIEERPETFDSLVAKLAEVEKELAETQKKLGTAGKDSSSSSTEDPLDAFMHTVRSEAAMDTVERRKLHVHAADLRKETQRLRRLVELTRPAQMPSLLPSRAADAPQPKKALPLFGAMKGGSKFKLRTGTIGKLPPKRPNLPAELFNMKELPPEGEEEEEEEEEENNNDPGCEEGVGSGGEPQQSAGSPSPLKPKGASPAPRMDEEPTDGTDLIPQPGPLKTPSGPRPEPRRDEEEEGPAMKDTAKIRTKKKVIGPSKPPAQLSKQYPEDDPDYCVWVPPAGQTGDGRTHLNDKYGY